MSRSTSTALFPSGTVNGIELYRVELTGHRDMDMFDADLPDQAWTFTDAAGHFHAYDADGKLPSLRHLLIKVDCDGSCGGLCDGEYDKRVHQCLMCDELVEPATRRGTRRVPGPAEYIVRASGPRGLVELHDLVVSFSCPVGFGSGKLNVVGVTMSNEYNDEAGVEIVLRQLHRRYGAPSEPAPDEVERARLKFLRDLPALAARVSELGLDGEVLP